MKEEPEWYGLKVLPVYLAISRKQLKESLEQLQNFEAYQRKNKVLKAPILNRLLKDFFEQNHSAWIFEEQCKRWDQEALSAKESQDLAELQKNVAAWSINNTELLSLAQDFKKKL